MKVKPAQFQQAAIEHIVERLQNRTGSRRFLLADEVGLGKTIVARGVIEALAQEHSRLSVMYLCSNAEIAEQNRQKLDPNAERPIGRVTELALTRSTPARDVLLYSFTPGTSLTQGTGMAWERKLLLYLVKRTLHEKIGRRWIEFFRCGVTDEKSWRRQVRGSLRNGEFERKTAGPFQRELREAWHAAHLGQGPDKAPLVATLREQVKAFNAKNLTHRSNRNAIVASLRAEMQRVALRTVKPQLIILDEVQRFRKVIDNANCSNELASELFNTDAAVLILSATPYRLLTLDHEVAVSGPSHHEDFFRTLEFLFGKDKATPENIRVSLKSFGDRLRSADLLSRHDEQLSAQKRVLEEDLRKVVCRTERNWYALDVRKGVDERGVEDREFPTRDELNEFFLIHRGLGKHLEGAGQVTEFWKSAPSLLTFLDAGYALHRRLRDNETVVPRELLTSVHEHDALISRNQRLRRVVTQALGRSDETPQLWTAPTFTYHRDQFFGASPRRKLLVFSGWRFVPKAVAVVVSQVASARLGGEPENKLQPLQFGEKRSFHVFDVCFPSLALARLFNPRSPDQDLVPGEMTAEDVLRSATDMLRTHLKSIGVEVSSTGADPMWRAIAKMEQREITGKALSNALGHWNRSGQTEPSDATLQHRDWFVEWLSESNTHLCISEARLRQMALISAFSPAVSLLRSLQSVFGDEAVHAELPRLLQLCMGPMRRYFNRPLVQQAIRRRNPATQWETTSSEDLGYAQRALLYAGEGHLQAVLDEHIYLLSHASQCTTVKDAIGHFAAIWGLSRGSRRTNTPRGHGAHVRINADAISHPTHFALAFGDDGARDMASDEDEGERLRKSVVREAFNSPFWPFVLATTSVGQEGLDFHLYCRDILHWNLPSNPVDLEQREGRINRRDCLAVRASIARDVPLSAIADSLADPSQNPWIEVFRRIETTQSDQKYKHGLYPHWIYECQNPSDTVRITRHVTFFETSRDEHAYERLKTGLALYRLVFGQAEQEDLLLNLENRLRERCTDPAERDRVLRRLSGYMLNLSPFNLERAQRAAAEEARQLLADHETAGIDQLLESVDRLRREFRDALDAVGDDLDQLVKTIRDALHQGDRLSPRVHRAVSALAYLRNPYDMIFDRVIEGGLLDDVEVIRAAARDIAQT